MPKAFYRALALAGVCAVTMITFISSARLAAAPQDGPLQDDQLPISFAKTVRPGMLKSDLAGAGGVLSRKSTGGLLGIDSVVNFSSYFYFPGFSFDAPQPTNFSWQYTMVGRAPFGRGEDDERGGTTSIAAPIVPVNVDLRNFDGTPRFVRGQRLISSVGPYVDPVLKSPIFDKASYDSSDRPTQFNDAVQRAQFFRYADDDWHTMLKPSVKTTRTMVLKRGTYFFALNADGTCCAYLLIDANAFDQALSPPTSDGSDTSSIMGAAEHSNEIRTSDISTFLFPNVLLYYGTLSNCCALGFHNYDVEQGSAANGWREKRYVMNFSSWLTPGLFGGDFSDVLPLSHEMAEIFNDPFVNNLTPWWLDPSGQICLNYLETGDVIEALPNLAFPMTMNGFTYHPQNEALLQWFAGETPSSAILRAYSYPDTTVLTSASVSRKVNCAP